MALCAQNEVYSRVWISTLGIFDLLHHGPEGSFMDLEYSWVCISILVKFDLLSHGLEGKFMGLEYSLTKLENLNRNRTT